MTAVHKSGNFSPPVRILTPWCWYWMNEDMKHRVRLSRSLERRTDKLNEPTPNIWLSGRKCCVFEWNVVVPSCCSVLELCQVGWAPPGCSFGWRRCHDENVKVLDSLSLLNLRYSITFIKALTGCYSVSLLPGNLYRDTSACGSKIRKWLIQSASLKHIETFINTENSWETESLRLTSL